MLFIYLFSHTQMQLFWVIFWFEDERVIIFTVYLQGLDFVAYTTT